MNLSVNEGLDLVLKATKERNRKEAWEMWLAFQPTTDDNKEIKPFEDFYQEQITPISTKSNEEIIQQTLKIQEEFNNGGGIRGDI